MKINQIPELLLIKQNKVQLPDDEVQRLMDLKIFDYIREGEINLPILEFIILLKELESIVYKHTSNC